MLAFENVGGNAFDSSLIVMLDVGLRVACCRSLLRLRRA